MNLFQNTAEQQLKILSIRTGHVPGGNEPSDTA